MKVAIVHYWLIGMRGGEKVIEAICDQYPDADIFTHVVDRDKISKKIAKHKIVTTWIARLPLAKRWYMNYLPFMPMALEQLDLRAYDLVISSESGPAKGVLVNSTATHICYCHTPMRYAWDMYQDYMGEQGFLKRVLMRPLLHYIRIWDTQTAMRVDHFVANSNYVANRITKVYRRESTVINPPVNTQRFAKTKPRSLDEREDYYVFFGQLVSYKRADLAVDAFGQLGKRLLVIGAGTELRNLKARAPENVTFTGRLSDQEVEEHLRACKALVFPGVEDFGIIPIEAMASGTPVIAYAKGGALETVKDGVSGLLFADQSIEGLVRAVEKFETNISKMDAAKVKAHAEAFDEAVFKLKFKSFVNAKHPAGLHYS